MDGSVKAGVSFGLTSSVITTLGLVIGLAEGIGSKAAVVGGILIIAVVDSLSDALAMHMSKESEEESTLKQVWESTLSTAGSKCVFALSFLWPVLLFDLNAALWTSVAWGLLLIVILSVKISFDRSEKVHRVVLEHLVLTLAIVMSSYYLGRWIKSLFP